MSDRLSGAARFAQPGQRRHLAPLQAEGNYHMTTVVPQQRTAVGLHRRELEVILASAPAGAATVVACAVPPATSGPPLHAHAASDETFFVLSGVLLVHAGGQMAAIPRGGLVHISRGMSHTFATTPDSPASFLVLHTPGGAGELNIAAAHTAQDHSKSLKVTTSSAYIRLG